uniref:Uncharacterized protein n=1 Tax=Strombidium inclinatum TaxID=197538 RepID=A0A7S3N1B9_9SPIT|mmetsp:Transcript_9447/g.14498  ORF Transcript_9447/g.14498 Transcript_9447/m.14498 type:complete len:126 (+) Transcript_9447:547-924(+)
MPNVRITGQHYEVTGPKALLSTLIGWVRFLGFVLLFAGEWVFGFFGGIQTMPDAIKDLHNYIKSNKWQVGIALFFVGSMLQAQLMQSGAFEIYINGSLEYSKLESRQMPTFDSIKSIFARNGIAL